MIVFILLVVFAALAVCCCCRTRQQARLARAKTYFDQIKDKEAEDEAGDPEARFIDDQNTAKGNRKSKKSKKSMKADEDEKLAKINPNSFISSASFEEE